MEPDEPWLSGPPRRCRDGGAVLTVSWALPMEAAQLFYLVSSFCFHCQGTAMDEGVP